MAYVVKFRCVLHKMCCLCVYVFGFAELKPFHLNKTCVLLNDSLSSCVLYLFDTHTHFKNIKYEVYILQSSNGSQMEHNFRNPPHFVSLVDPTLRDAYHETDAVLKHYLHHDNAAPFIAKQLLKRFGKSNPSPQYVKTVATAFRDGSYVWADGTDSVSF